MLVLLLSLCVVSCWLFVDVCCVEFGVACWCMLFVVGVVCYSLVGGACCLLFDVCDLFLFAACCCCCWCDCCCSWCLLSVVYCVLLLVAV